MNMESYHIYSLPNIQRAVHVIFICLSEPLCKCHRNGYADDYISICLFIL